MVSTDIGQFEILTVCFSDTHLMGILFLLGLLYLLTDPALLTDAVIVVTNVFISLEVVKSIFCTSVNIKVHISCVFL